MNIACDRISKLNIELNVDRTLGLDCGYATGMSNSYDELWKTAEGMMKSNKRKRYAQNPDVERRFKN